MVGFARMLGKCAVRSLNSDSGSGLEGRNGAALIALAP